jgi:hypothetical protein
MEKISKASIQDAPKFDGIDASVGGASGELIKVADAQAELEKWHKKQLEMQKELLDEKEINEQTYADRVADINKTNADRLQDIQAGYTSASLSMFSDLAGQSAQLLQSIGQEGSIAYKNLFFASKAAIAQAVINTELAATKAMAEGGYIWVYLLQQRFAQLAMHLSGLSQGKPWPGWRTMASTECQKREPGYYRKESASLRPVHRRNWMPLWIVSEARQGQASG